MLIELGIYLNTACIRNLNKIVVTRLYKMYLIVATEQSKYQLHLNNVRCITKTIMFSRHIPKNE